MANRRSARTALVTAVAAVAVAAGSVGGPAQADPDGRPSIDSVARQVAELESQARAAAERREAARQAVETGKAELFDVEREAAASQARLTSSKRAIGRLAAASYRDGVVDPAMLRVIFSDTPEDALHQAASVARVMDHQDAAIDRVAVVTAELREDEAALAEQLAQLREDEQAVARAQQEVEDRTAAARALLATLREEERQRIAAEAARAAAAREAERASRSSRRPSEAAPAPRAAAFSRSGGGRAAAASPGRCAPSGSRGAERGLTPSALSVMRCGLAAFPQVPSAGGLGNRGNATDHDDGRAVDFMIPAYRSGAGNDLGWRVAEWATKQPGVSYVIFDGMMYGSWSSSRGWTPMGNRGSDTANHRDHVHVSVNR